MRRFAPDARRVRRAIESRMFVKGSRSTMAEADVKFTQIEELSPKGDKAANMEPTKRERPATFGSGQWPHCQVALCEAGSAVGKGLRNHGAGLRQGIPD